MNTVLLTYEPELESRPLEVVSYGSWYDAETGLDIYYMAMHGKVADRLAFEELYRAALTGALEREQGEISASRWPTRYDEGLTATVKLSVLRAR